MFKKTDVVSIFVLVLVFGQTECAGAALGAGCTDSSGCDKTPSANAVCDVLVTPNVCKIKNTGDCSTIADKCVSNATCANNVCVCSTKYKDSTTDKLCAKVLGHACSTIADCNTVANSNCTGSGSKTCTCNTGYTAQGADCTAVLGLACSTTVDCNTVANSDCTGSGSKTCTCNTGYTAQGAVCTAVLGLACSTDANCNTVAHSNCTGSGSKTCTCNTGYTAQGAVCTAAGGGLMNMMNLGLMLTSLFAVKIV